MNAATTTSEATITNPSEWSETLPPEGPDPAVPFPPEAPTGDELDSLIIAASGVFADDVKDFTIACLRSGRYTADDAFREGCYLAERLSGMRPGGAFLSAAREQSEHPL